MNRSIINNKLTKQYILSKVSQITIFATYLNLSNTVIQNCIDKGNLICNPLRDDKHPTCGFKYDSKGKLKFRDFAGFFWGDCFDVVALVISNIYNKEYNVNDKHDFVKILKHITYTFKNVFYGNEKDISLVNEINNTINNIKNKKPIIEVVVRDWNEKDIKYWKQFNIDIAYLNINFVYAVDQYYINRKVNPQPKYYYEEKDPCYAYILGKDRNGVFSVKLYFPQRNKSDTSFKFITNCNHLEGIWNLDRKEYDIIVITKSTKDRLAIGAAIKHMQSLYGVANIGLINIPHETYKLRQNEYDWLISKVKANGEIVSLMDNDRVGKIEAKWLRDNYNIIPILIPTKYKSKDFAELVVNHKNEIKSIINDTIKYIINYGRKDI